MGVTLDKGKLKTVSSGWSQNDLGWDYVMRLSDQGDEVRGIKERCLPLSSFDGKKSRSEAERALDCHILAPVKKISIQGGNPKK